MKKTLQRIKPIMSNVLTMLLAVSVCLLLVCVQQAAAEPVNEVPTMLENIRSTSTEDMIILSWDTVAGADYYEIEADGVVAGSCIHTEYRHEGVSSVEQHTYRVRAVNTDGAGDWSSSVTQTTANPAAAIMDNWAYQLEMPTARFGAGITSVNEKIYALGGYGQEYCGRVEEYNPETGDWVIKSSMSVPRYGAGVVSVEDKIYVIGGYDGSSYVGTVEIYNPDTDTWSTGADMPTPRNRMGTAVVNGKIYAIGGYNDSMGTLNTVEEYDPQTDTWTVKARMITPRSRLAVAQANGKVYAAGGYNGIALGDIEEYDPVMDTWVKKGSLPVPLSGMAAVELNSRIFFLGGYNSTAFDTVYEYDPVNNMFTTQGNMRTERYDFGAAVVKDSMYIIGGTNEAIPLDRLEQAVFIKLEPPLSLAASPSGSTVDVDWSEVNGASGYHMEADGEVIGTGTDTEYAHEELPLNGQHAYRVRSVNTAGSGKWSEVVSTINWEDGMPGICIASANWIKESDDEKVSEVLVKVNNMESLYTANIELKYDPNRLDFDAESITNLVWVQEQDIYISVLPDEQSGIVKIIISRTGDVQGKDGQFALVRLKFTLSRNEDAQLNIEKAELVDDTGRYIEVSGTPALDIRVMTE